MCLIEGHLFDLIWSALCQRRCLVVRAKIFNRDKAKVQQTLASYFYSWSSELFCSPKFSGQCGAWLINWRQTCLIFGAPGVLISHSVHLQWLKGVIWGLDQWIGHWDRCCFRLLGHLAKHLVTQTSQMLVSCSLLGTIRHSTVMETVFHALVNFEILGNFASIKCVLSE